MTTRQPGLRLPSDVLLAGGFLLTLACSYLMLYLPTHQRGTLTIVLFVLCTLWMLKFWQLAQAQPGEHHLELIVALGVLARLLLFATPGFTSNDTERYLWDGAVLLNGFDPYQLHPDHPTLAPLRAVWPTPEEHAAYQTLYPPLALAIFAACASAGADAGLWVWKLVVTVASLISLWVMRSLLKTLGQTQHLSLFALSPLVLLETGVGAHVDSLSVLAVCVMLWCVVHSRWTWAGVAIGLGASIKLLPILALGPLLFAHPLRRWPWILLGTGIALLACYGLALQMALVPVGSLATFFAKWRFGSPVFSLLDSLPLFAEQHNNGLWTLVPIVGVAIVAGLGALWLSRRDFVTGLLAMFSIPLVLSPVVFPWYLMVLVPLLAMRPSPVVILWVSLAPVTYEVLNGFASTGLWQPAVWPLGVIAGGWFFGFCYRYRRRALKPEML